MFGLTANEWFWYVSGAAYGWFACWALLIAGRDAGDTDVNTDE